MQYPQFHHTTYEQESTKQFIIENSVFVLVKWGQVFVTKVNYFFQFEYKQTSKYYGEQFYFYINITWESEIDASR